MLIAGSDVSGNTIGGGQHRHISFLIGSEESINKLYNDIHLKEIHMVRLTESARKHVQQKLDFRGNDVFAWCFHVEKQHIINHIANHERLHPKNKPRESIFRHFDYLFLQQFKEQLEAICYSHKTSLDELTVECDSDMQFTIQNWKMRKKSRGKAYEIADAIAYFNEKDRKTKGCVDVDLRDKIYRQMEYDLLK
ncbi:MAG: hypothetical protein ACREAK_05930 [Nitrosarchaeum sp.]